MSWFKDLRIGTKLVTAFCVVAVIAGIVGWIGVTTTKDALALQKQIYERNLVPIQTLGDISLRFQDLRVALRDVLLTDGDADRTRKSSEAVEMLYRKVNEDLTNFEAAGLLKFADQKEVYSKLMPDLKAYAEFKDRILTAARDNNLKDGIGVLTGPAYLETTQAISDGIIKIRDLKSVSAARKNAVGAKEGNFAVFMSITLTVVGMILAIVLGLFMSRLISRPVRDLAKKAGQVAEGDLMVDVTASSRDEIGQLSESFARMIESLRTLIGQVGSASDHLASAATELTSNSEQITAGAQEVASQSSAVASAGEEMAATSKDIARNCQVAVKEGKEASDAAQTGVEVVNKTVEVMGRIADRVHETARTIEDLGSRSHQIGAIINTIQEIADQTNLLALNAAIEAARAGDQGRGFAVVADEVRALSERTTKATAEIGAMIQAIQEGTRTAVSAMEEGVKEVKAGTAEASRSGEALQMILAQINEVSGQVHQVATAAEEQTATTSEISSNMLRISNVVQQTADGARESASSSNQLAKLADDLQRLIGRFRIAA
ncbi:MAG: methyl-accepting chemotaxis protein [Deltaproteobacteria bacterium]|nr:methyl-accepting chemotaxis protein [Deltaproteobacteria bacterium]